MILRRSVTSSYESGEECFTTRCFKIQNPRKAKKKRRQSITINIIILQAVKLQNERMD
jgi:hypothetical protein